MLESLASSARLFLGFSAIEVGPQQFFLELSETAPQIRAQGLGFRVYGLGFGVQGLGFRVQGLGLRV